MAVDKNIRILVVDDSSAIRRIVTSALKQIGFKNITEAADGALAWEVLQAETIQLILSDYKMPRMSGMELLEKVRESREHRNIPFVMVTAEAQKEAVVEAVQKRVSGYIVKPFKPDDLGRKILKVVS
ncbi:response regulator [Paucidesulfovibrio longus]|uniref:response regulator n=1 Tax=Paucidesulfovibrio longus TaxID=889 RepID=UPI0003B6BBA7|nr:response regulator [Paucidesulfovibrio longus]